MPVQLKTWRGDFRGGGQIGMNMGHLSLHCDLQGQERREAVADRTTLFNFTAMASRTILKHVDPDLTRFLCLKFFHSLAFRLTGSEQHTTAASTLIYPRHTGACNRCLAENKDLKLMPN